jgi:hypothetical protein
MPKPLQLIVPLALLGSLSLDAQKPAPPRLDGHWEGVIVAVPAEMEADVEIDVARSGDGLQGQLSFPTQEKTYPIQDLLLRERAVSFSVVDERKTGSFFTGTISADGEEIAGTMTENLQKYPFSLRRREPRPAVGGNFLPPVLRVADDGAELRRAFNAGAGHVRLLMTLSPSSVGSKTALRIVQRYVLERIASPGLKVYVVWEPVVRADTEQASYAASRLVSDPRVQQFWSGSRFTGHSFASLAGKDSEQIWDAFLIFGGDKTWTGAPPIPDRFRLAPLPGMEVQANLRMNGAKLAEDIEARLGPPHGRPARK